MRYEITAEMNLKKIAGESREVAKALNEFADNLEDIEKKYTEKEDELVYRAHWHNNINGTISCSHCGSWFQKDDRYFYMHYCPYCGKKMAESEEGGWHKE